ncbi:MAG: cobalamin biosynthesis protein [Candidatus Methanoperedens nitroreducens]|uniref:Cobalamin biosynthesis protein n=1 Tax=Candidatus Methanoperedens nitratireducens TaxID=1392998 RepID=A0A0P8A5D2_9EURY|nr:GTP-binding protein [Candidatus Methanoperedens sp. BLZ2]KAB2947562.1 MAG: hypothetical protein F9K14_03920 [Candidatus Methanoperedens sp.]KPQ41729.1 MAG: cobalamin biosynthesis protein [Candidatus Methanoperedens sp. BLZ1]MBZ0177575.1 hypothetical protein [Candidatus Methanoperedens nitroreducens]CAG0952781.1 Putative metal chaperone YciC [Methanosarcinales archaeon]MCX9078059.1 hypothetical protein [Candidatus Methanoperedens sp.]
MEKIVKLGIVGGFLGAGKTSTIIEIGKKLVTDYGKRVAIITNDQGEELVDTKIVKDYGFEVGEVLGGCFCCKFPDFMASSEDILKKTNPDIILAEPVGSCTDIPATLHMPIRKFYKNTFKIAPHIVLVDARRILNMSSEMDLVSPDTSTGYLFSHQIQEAEVLAVNKIDLVSPDQIDQIKEVLKKLNSRAEIMLISAANGTGMDALAGKILNDEYKSYYYPHVDYKVYGSAEAEMGWLNGVWKVDSKQDFKVKEFIRDILITAATDIKQKNGDIGHVKIYFSNKKNFTKASFVSFGQDVCFTGLIPDKTGSGEMAINARVAIGHKELKQSILDSLEIVSSKYDTELNTLKIESFSPPQPEPHHRILG